MHVSKEAKLSLKARQFWKSAAGKSEKARQRNEKTGRALVRNLGRTGPNRHSIGPVVHPWQVGRALTSGRSVEEAAAKFGIGRRTASYKAEAIHLNYGSVFICDQGTPFRDGDLTALRRAAGFLTARQAELSMGLPTGSCGPRKGGPKAIRMPEMARKAITWRDEVIRGLSRSENDKVRSYKNHEVIRTLLPKLGSLRDALAKAFKVIGVELRRQTGWRMTDVWHFVEERVRHDHTEVHWHKTFCFLWEIELVLERRLPDLAGTDPRSVPHFVLEILAERYGVHWQQIKLALNRTNAVRTIADTEMFRIISLARLSSVTPESKIEPKQTAPSPKRGRKKGQFDKDANEINTFCAAWLRLGQSKYRLAMTLYPGRSANNARGNLASWLKNHGSDIVKLRESMDDQIAQAVLTARPHR